MKVRWASYIGSISLSVLVLGSLFVMVHSSTTYAEEEQAPVNTATGSSGSDEVTAASGSNRFVVWVNVQSCNGEIFFRRSIDNGATWQPKVTLSKSTCVDTFNPQIVVSGSNVYVVWGEFDTFHTTCFIQFRRSTDNGATWGTVELAAVVGDLGVRCVDPQMAVSGSNISVVFSDGYPNYEIFLTRSTDNGATWKPKVNLSNNPGQSVVPQLAVSGSGVYVVWEQWNADKTLSDIFFRRSTDNGATWKFFKNLSSTGGSGSPQIAVSGSNVFVVWTDDTPGNNDIFFRRSTDNGATWKSKVNISNNAGDSLTPQVAFFGTNVYLAWSDDTPTNNDIFVRRSADNGATWQVAKNLSNNSGPSLNPRIAASASSVHVVWDQLNTSQTLSDVFFRRSADNGVTWNLAKNLSSNGNSDDPDLAVSGSIVYAVWVNSGTGNGDIFFRRSIDNGATWQASKNLSSNTNGSFDPQIGV